MTKSIMSLWIPKEKKNDAVKGWKREEKHKGELRGEKIKRKADYDGELQATNSWMG